MFSFSLGKYPVLELLNCMIILLLFIFFDNSTFNSLRNLHAIFHTDYTSLHSHQQCTRIPFSPHPQQHLLFLVFFSFSHSDRYKVISHCGFNLRLCKLNLIINDVEQLLMCLLEICRTSLDECLFRSSVHF